MICGALLVALAACKGAAPPPPYTQPTAAELACQRDTDCTKVSTDCCGCTSGGSEIVVNVHAAATRRPVNCGDVSCLTVISKTPECVGTAVCRAGSCVIEPPLPPPPRPPTDRCETDRDCTFVETSCCGCDAGGHREAMTTSRAAVRVPPDCKNTTCPQVMTETVDCTGLAACRAGTCIAVPSQ